jgi:hypothetical protein
MNERNDSTEADEGPRNLNISALLDRVAAAMIEIEQAKEERSTYEMRAARAHLAALHGVARLRRQADRKARVA